MSYLGDLFLWLWSIVNSFAGYATGGVIVALVWLWSTLQQRPTSRKAGIGLAIMFLFLALFGSWRNEHKALEDANKRIGQIERDSKDAKSKSIGKLEGEVSRRIQLAEQARLYLHTNLSKRKLHFTPARVYREIADALDGKDIFESKQPAVGGDPDYKEWGLVTLLNRLSKEEDDAGHDDIAAVSSVYSQFVYFGRTVADKDFGLREGPSVNKEEFDNAEYALQDILKKLHPLKMNLRFGLRN